MALRQNRVTVVLTIVTWGPSGTLYIYIYIYTAHIPAQKKTSITKTIKNNIYIYIYTAHIPAQKDIFSADADVWRRRRLSLRHTCLGTSAGAYLAQKTELRRSSRWDPWLNGCAGAYPGAEENQSSCQIQDYYSKNRLSVTLRGKIIQYSLYIRLSDAGVASQR